MRARGSDYHQLLEETLGLRFHNTDPRTIAKPDGAKALLESMDIASARAVTVRPPRNSAIGNFFGDKERDGLIRLRQRFDLDKEKLVFEFIWCGQRLVDGPPGSL